MPNDTRGVSGHIRQHLIGSLQYAPLATRPDISFAISKLAQFLVNPGRIHLEADLRILRYLKGTKEWSLNLGGEVADIAGFTDSGWGDQDDRKSISVNVFRMGQGDMSWKTKKQTSVALSSVETEYMAMCQAAKEALWLTGLLEHFRLDLWSPLVLRGDNQGALALTENPVFRPRSKHIALQYHFTRSLVQAGQLIVKYICRKWTFQSSSMPCYV